MNPVVLLDEVDKVGADYRGDPAAALLEVLDPAQNHTFRDHYLELDLDLSDVLFIATANVVEQIPSALLDRMELVTLDGYTEDDKVAIARDFLLPRQLERAALTDRRGHRHRRGAARDRRQLHPRGRRPADGAAARQGAAQGGDPARDRRRGEGRRRRGRPQGPGRTAALHARVARAHRRCPVSPRASPSPGWVATCSTSRRPRTTGRPGLTLTGQLGDVMKESAQIALTFVRSHAAELGVDPAFLDRAIHVHVPAGAVPKDGRRPASRWSPRWRRWPPGARCAPRSA